MIIQSPIYSLVLRELSLASLVIAPSCNNIEQELLLLLANEYRPTCSFSMINPGSLTMGFAEADPRHWRRLWELHRLESQSRRSHLQQIATRGLEPDLAHSRSSSSPQT